MAAPAANTTHASLAQIAGEHRRCGCHVCSRSLVLHLHYVASGTVGLETDASSQVQPRAGNRLPSRYPSPLRRPHTSRRHALRHTCPRRSCPQHGRPCRVRPCRIRPCRIRPCRSHSCRSYTRRRARRRYTRAEWHRCRLERTDHLIRPTCRRDCHLHYLGLTVLGLPHHCHLHRVRAMGGPRCPARL